jgi:hypothetical protein
MKRTSLVATLLAAAFVLVPATAQAFHTYWEVKGTSGPYKKLALATPLTVHSQSGFGITGETSSKPFKGACEVADTEVVENEPISEEGIDKMTTFEGPCGSSAPYPCALNGEGYLLKGAKLPWLSELILPSYDAFEGVEVEVECLTSLAKALYHPFGHVWEPKLAVNALKSVTASGEFKHSPGNYFYLVGTDALTPGSPYVYLR